jgi:hypothetical protein
MQPRAIGMTINHHEIEHTLQQMSDVIRNAAYTVANERYPIGHEKRQEFFDETGTLLVMDETSIKALLKDAIEHYLQFHAVARGGSQADFNYYLNDSFEMIADYVNRNGHIVSYLSAQFASACGVLAATLAPVIEDLSGTGHGVERVESFTLNTQESYYLVVGENPDDAETYDPKDDDLSTVDVYQSPEVLDAIAERNYSRALNDIIGETTWPTLKSIYKDDKRLMVNLTMQDFSKVLHEPIVTQPFHRHINSDEYAALNSNFKVPDLG